MRQRYDQLQRRVLGICLDIRGQDLIEYALMAAFVAVAAGAIFPSTITPSISTIYSKISSSLDASPGGSGA
ncbi:MAG: hypothetical protein ABI824_05585 [Acidobacteriota bacterium]